jgi:drug/metabolite transporter (DMT)-like permease
VSLDDGAQAAGEPLPVLARTRDVGPVSIDDVTSTVSPGRGMPISAQALGIVLVLVSAAGFGSGALFVQPLYDAGMQPLAVLFWRFTTAALFTWGYLLLSARRRSALLALTRRRVAVLLFLGTIYVGNSYAFIASLEVVPITLTEIIAYIYPALVAVLATRFARRLEGRRAWMALGISLAGVALTLGGIPGGEAPPLWGIALAFAHPLIYSLWIIIQARMAGERPRRACRQADEITVDIPPGDAETPVDGPDPSPAAALMTTATAVVFAAALLGTDGSLSPLDVPVELWPPLLGLGLVATAIAIQTFYAGVRRVGGARAALISTVEPVYAVVLAVLLFGEHLAPIQIVGGAMVIFGVILAETGRPDRVTAETGSPA